jgi:hypothetical protein
MSNFKPDVIERAYEIASSGDVHQQLGGATIRRQLRELCRAAFANNWNKSSGRSPSS